MLRAQTMLFLFLVAVAEPAGAKELWEGEWIEVRSPHFRIKSAISEKRTRALAVDLEHFRRAAEFVTNIGRFEERIPTHLYLLPTASRELGLHGGIAGYFIPHMRANYAAVQDRGAMSDEILKHEYVHFLVHNRDALSYPAWFDEGFAEVLSTLLVKDGKTLEYGNAVPERLFALSYMPWMPFKKLLGAGSSQEFKGAWATMFYSQSWLLTHYLLMGRSERSFGSDNAAFLRLRESGTPAPEAFERAFSLNPDGLQKALARYLKKARYTRVILNTPYPPVETSASPLNRDVIAAELGLLCLIRGELACAKRAFDASLTANPDNAMALVGVGDLHKFEERYDEAAPYYQRAIASEPGNALHQLDYAEYFLDRAQAEQDATRAASLLVEARRHFARSYKLDPNVPETLAMNGASFLGDPSASGLAIASLEEAHYQLPSQTQIKLLLAQAYAQADRKPEAAKLLRSLVAWSHSEGSEAALKLLAELEASERPAGEDAAQAATDEDAAAGQ